MPARQRPGADARSWAEPSAGTADGGQLAIGRPYFRAARVHWRFCLLFVAAVLAGSFLVLNRRTPTYEATAEVLVTPVDPTDTTYAGLPVVHDLGDPTRTIQTAAALVENREIADAAADRLGDPWTGRRVADAVTVSPKGQTNVVEIRASADAGDEAAAVADAYAAAVIDVRTEALRAGIDTTVQGLTGELAGIPPELVTARDALQQRVAQLQLLRAGGDPTVSLVQSASAPSSEDVLPTGVVLAIAAAAALLLAPAAALLVELAGPRLVRGTDDLAGALSAPVLAAVPKRRRRRSSRPVRARREGERTAYRALGIQVEHLSPPRVTVMVVSPSRRDGRTSVVINLAHELAGAGAKVAVADLDAQKPDLTAALAGGTLPVLRLDPDGQAPDSYATPTELLREASRVYDHLVIDTPPLLQADDVLRLASEVDAVIVVARCDRTSRERLDLAGRLLVTVGAAPAGGVILQA